MNNNNDQAQFAKDVYQVPSQKAEPIEMPVVKERAIESRFTEIAREETRIAFEAMKNEYEMAAQGIEPNREAQPMTVESHPGAVRLSTTLSAIDKLREGASFDSQKAKLTREEKIHKLVELEVKLGRPSFPADPQVANTMFFYLPNGDKKEIFYQQESVIPEKNFTNSYTVRLDGIHKSSTFFDPLDKKTKHALVTPDEQEIDGLIIATEQHLKLITENVYTKSPQPAKRRFRLKSDYDLTA